MQIDSILKYKVNSIKVANFDKYPNYSSILLLMLEF